MRPTMRVFEMVGSELETTPTVSTPACRGCCQLRLLRIVSPETARKAWQPRPARFMATLALRQHARNAGRDG